MRRSWGALGRSATRGGGDWSDITMLILCECAGNFMHVGCREVFAVLLAAVSQVARNIKVPKVTVWETEFILPKFLIFVVPSIMLYSSEISPTRCNNCVFILRNGFTLHVSGYNLTHHQEYICCIWPQVSRLT